MNVDTWIRIGFWSQLVLLFLVDWGTVLAFSRMEVAFGHYLGFAVVNVILLSLAWHMWGWLKTKRSGPPKWVEKARALEAARLGSLTDPSGSPETTGPSGEASEEPKA